MSEFKKPDIVNEEIILNPKKVLLSKTNKEGIIEFANDYFMEISGYEEYELMGKSIFCVQHPDMPDVIFKIIYERLLERKNFMAIIKKIAKNGKFYWSISDFAYNIDDKGEVTAIYNRRKAISDEAKEYFGGLYKTLRNIELKKGVTASENFLNGLLEEKRITFDELISRYNQNTPIKNQNALASSTTKETEQPVEDIRNIVNEEVKTTESKIDKVEPVKTVNIDSKPKVETTKKIDNLPTESIDSEEVSTMFDIGKIESVENITNVISEKIESIKDSGELIADKVESKINDIKPTIDRVETVKKPISTSIDGVNVNQNSPNIVPEKTEPIQTSNVETVKEVQKNTENTENQQNTEDKSTDSKKSLFQRFFGKTEEEIEEDRLRREKRSTK
jgi:PAS domain S-box-containing protein